MLKILHFLNYFIILSLSLFLSSCDKPSDDSTFGEDSFQNNADEYPEVRKNLDSFATDFFKENNIGKQKWIDKQILAYKAIELFSSKDLTLEELFALKLNISKEFPNDYVQQLNELHNRVSGLIQINKFRYTYSSDVYTLTCDKLQTLFFGDFAMQANVFKKWAKFYQDVLNDKLKFKSEADFQNSLSYAFERSPTEPTLAYKYFKLYLNDYNSSVSKNAKNDSEITDTPEHFEQKLSPQEKAEALFRNSVFTLRGPQETIYTAILTKIKDKIVILCPKEFLNSTSSTTFKNSTGSIKCSKFFICKDAPIFIAIPDSEVSENFKPLELVSPKDDILDKELFMIAPTQNGFRTFLARVFSEGDRYLDFDFQTAPRVIYKSKNDSFTRYSSDVLVSVSEKKTAGEYAVLIDPHLGKLVSYALTIHNPGTLTTQGTTGSKIGFENNIMPDFNTIIRQLDATIKNFEPFSSIQFLRLSILNDWQTFNYDELIRQQTLCRKITDDNNDFLMFFKSNTYGDVLKSKKLGTIAEKYRSYLLEKRLERASYERQYKNYMMDILFAIKREIVKYDDFENFYSIYKNEMQYQWNLSNSMYDYLSEVIRDDNFVNILHVDLITRYNESTKVNVKTVRFGGSVGGGY